MVAHRNCYRNWAALTTTLRFLARARGVGTTTSPAERAADAGAERHARGESNAGLSTSISFVLFLLVDAD